MISLLLSSAIQYGGAMLVGIIVGLLFKSFFASQVQKKIRGYQGDIIRSHARILELEALNDRLEKRLQGAETTFKNDLLVMN
ncbi:MAG: hypothetical protein JWQ96_2181 [Segetibacter sp.]|nr:hypothetical protein [Segetibacter sp.]